MPCKQWCTLNTILSWFPSQSSDYNNTEARCMALTQAYSFRSNFCQTAQHVFYNKVIKSDIRSSNGNLKIQNVFCRVLKIVIFSITGFTDGPTIKPAFLYPYVHYYHFLIKAHHYHFKWTIIFALLNMIQYSDYMFILWHWFHPRFIIWWASTDLLKLTSSLYTHLRKEALGISESFRPLASW